MRSPRHRLLMLAAIPVFAVAGCASEGADPGAEDSPSTSTSTTSEPEPTATGSVEDIELEREPVEGGEGDRRVPTLALPEEPFEVADTEVEVLAEGQGEAITAEQDVTIKYLAVNGSTGEEVLSTFPTDETVEMELSAPGLLVGLSEAIVGKKPGAEVIAAVPPSKGFAETGGNEALGIGADDTLVFYIEVVSAETPLTEAQGEPVEPREGLPTVEADGASPAQITIPEGEDPPEELVVQQLVKGDGPKVRSGQTVEVHYTGVTWEQGEQFDSSLEGGEPFPFQVGTGSVIEGWDEGLIGQPVGSRVLLVVPPDLGYGGSAGHELEDNTLVFVVDILDAS